jgi:hypothetical protein
MSAQHPAPANEALGLLARDEVPFLFDSVLKAPDGSVGHHARDTLSFCFDYLGVTFDANGRRSGDRLIMTLSANLGPLPYSAESITARHAIQELVAASATAEGSVFSLADDQTIRLVGSFDLDQPASPMLVLAVVTEFLIGLKPWLERIAELLADPSLHSHGRA